MFALVDANSFYCSCERVFNPSLRGKPVVVLSNNDGCIIALTPEVKALGIKMGTPYFQNREVLEKNHVHVYSSNYALYGDMSRRVAERSGAADVLFVWAHLFQGETGNAVQFQNDSLHHHAKFRPDDAPIRAGEVERRLEAKHLQTLPQASSNAPYPIQGQIPQEGLGIGHDDQPTCLLRCPVGDLGQCLGGTDANSAGDAGFL